MMMGFNPSVAVTMATVLVSSVGSAHHQKKKTSKPEVDLVPLSYFKINVEASGG